MDPSFQEFTLLGYYFKESHTCIAPLLQKEVSIIAHNEYSNSTLWTDKGAIKIMGLAYKFFIVYTIAEHSFCDRAWGAI